MLGEQASACPGKLMDVQSFSGTKNKWFPSGRGAKSVSCHHVPRPEGSANNNNNNLRHATAWDNTSALLQPFCVCVCVAAIFFHASFVKL